MKFMIGDKVELTPAMRKYFDRPTNFFYDQYPSWKGLVTPLLMGEFTVVDVKADTGQVKLDKLPGILQWWDESELCFAHSVLSDEDRLEIKSLESVCGSLRIHGVYNNSYYVKAHVHHSPSKHQGFDKGHVLELELREGRISRTSQRNLWWDTAFHFRRGNWIAAKESDLRVFRAVVVELEKIRQTAMEYEG